MVSGSGWWTAVRVVLAMTAVACALGFLQKQPCRADGLRRRTSTPGSATPTSLRSTTAAASPQGALPYVDTGDWEPLEYPVVTGAFMTVAAWLTKRGRARTASPRYVTFFDVNVVMLATCALDACWFVAITHRRRPWDAAMLAPGLVLTAYINWDLLAVALAGRRAVGLVAAEPVARRRPHRARHRGEALPVAAARSVAPAVLAGRADAPVPARPARGASWAWLVVNIPVILAARDGLGDLLHASAVSGPPASALSGTPCSSTVSASHRTISTPSPAGLFVLACLGIAWLGLAAPHRPRLAQLLFLVVAAFLVTNKVYSPQYVLWLVFLFPLARPRWRDYLWWLLFEASTSSRCGGTCRGSPTPTSSLPGLAAQRWRRCCGPRRRWCICGLVVRDILRPELDPVREVDELDRRAVVDDPGGGVLDGAPDASSL